jgi:hypothetical protein
MNHETKTSEPAATPAPQAPATALPYILECTALLQQIEAALPPAAAITAAGKKTRAKARKGGEQYAPRVLALARQYGVELKLAPTAAIERDSAEALALLPLQQLSERVQKRISDRLFVTRSSSWSGTSKLYTVLKRLSKDEGDLEAGLAPVEQFFNHRHPLVRAKHPKTAKGKAALAAKRVAEEGATSSGSQEPTNAAPATNDPAPPAPPVTAANPPETGTQTHAAPTAANANG